MRWIHLGLTVLLAVFMLFMGAQKFGAANPVFQYIAEQSGIGLFEPVLRIATGVAEVLAAALLLAGLFVGAIRSCGGMLSAGIIGGAIVFHLTP
ncbi:MAG: DoxX family protein, partial [Alphaproteobacteria bacterium]|nr:DoxX family protein [Alphaproteobacteria bacterium]